LKEELLTPVSFKDPDSGQTVTFTEDYAKKINDRLLKDASFKDQLAQEWRDAARAKYQKVLADLNQAIKQGGTLSTTTTTQSSSSSPAPTPTTTSSAQGGVCGPGVILGFALLPLLALKKKRE